MKIGISQSLITNPAICETVNQIEIIYQGNFPLAAITIHGAGNSSNHQVGLKLSNNNNEKKKEKEKKRSINFVYKTGLSFLETGIFDYQIRSIKTKETTDKIKLLWKRYFPR